MDMALWCRWNVDESLPAAQAQPRASVDLQRLKQQQPDSTAFLASTSTHARSRQAQDRRTTLPHAAFLKLQNHDPYNKALCPAPASHTPRRVYDDSKQAIDHVHVHH
jgi:hypothetical protein